MANPTRTRKRSDNARSAIRPIPDIASRARRRRDSRKLIFPRKAEPHPHSTRTERIEILVDHGTDHDAGWEEIADINRLIVKLSHPIWKRSGWSRGPLRFARAVAWGTKLWWVGLFARQDTSIITYGHEHGFVFALWQWLGSAIVAPRKHYMIDLLLMPPRKRWAGRFDRGKMWLFDKVVVGAFVWGKADVLNFARWYGLNESKFHFHPYHTTLQNFTVTIKDSGYIFAGGNSARDYVTAIAALRDCPIPVVIATTTAGVAELARPYPHITVKGVCEQEFRSLFAGCSIFVEAHDPAFPRTIGHQTMLNAMACGKPLVIADPISTEWYVRDGIDGLVVPVGNAVALRTAVNLLLRDPEFAKKLGKTASERIRHHGFDIPTTLARMYRIAAGSIPLANENALDPNRMESVQRVVART